MVRLGAPVGIVGEGQDGLDDHSIRIVPGRRQDDDGFGSVRAADLERGQVERIARAANDAGAANVN